MAAIHDLIEQISDPRLRARLAAEWETASKEKKFGLVFEDHLPEVMPLYGRTPRKNDLVCRKSGPLKEIWLVRSIRDGAATCVKPVQDASISGVSKLPVEPVSFALDELLVVRQFGDPIFPSLTPIAYVENGGKDDPWHTLIEADNYHALQLLEYLYAGKVDCIYIDPPYNTGARDWKYNNDYVDLNDSWRHSKWLAFMERRLKLAYRLLNAEIGVLIVTIDDNEFHHLRCLLADVFPGKNIFTIVIEHNKRGRQGEEFAKTHEYAFVVCPDKPGVIGEEPTDGVIGGETRNLRRTGNNSLRTDRHKQFYPIWVDPVTLEIVQAGDFLPLGEKRSDKHKDGLVPIWPIDKQGVERNWYYGPERLMAEYKEGKVFARKQSYGIHIYYTLKEKASKRYKTVWSKPTLDASTYGSEFLTKVFGTSPFTFPKSLYAVRDSIATACLHRKDALILDFFAGSGTTLNAINLLNAGDGGKRRCILVTNNEVSADESESLREQGFETGDPDWEKHGICRSVTWPRSKYTILGRRDDGTVLEGDYLTGKTILIERSRNFIHLSFIDSDSIKTTAKRKQLLALIDGLPQTLIKDLSPYILSEKHDTSILFDINFADEWIATLSEQNHITKFHIIGGNKREFDALKERVNELLGPVLVTEDEKVPLSKGFSANLEYFKLDFLERDRVALKRAFREILPLLWLKSGAIGPRPSLPKNESEPDIFIPKGTNFVVLLDESRIAKMLKALTKRQDLDHFYIVTDADESFKAMAEDAREALSLLNPQVQIVQLYRDYLVNFMINKFQGTVASGAHEVGI